MRKRILSPLLCFGLCLSLLSANAAGTAIQPERLEIIADSGGLHIEAGREIEVPVIFLPEGSTHLPLKCVIELKGVATVTRMDVDSITVKGFTPGVANMQVYPQKRPEGDWLWHEIMVWVYPKGSPRPRAAGFPKPLPGRWPTMWQPAPETTLLRLPGCTRGETYMFLYRHFNTRAGRAA